MQRSIESYLLDHNKYLIEFLAQNSLLLASNFDSTTQSVPLLIPTLISESFPNTKTTTDFRLSHYIASEKGEFLNSWNDYQKLYIAINSFSDNVYADIFVAEYESGINMNKNLLNRRLMTCMEMFYYISMLHTSQDSRTYFKKLIWNVFLSLSWIKTEINHFWGAQGFGHPYYSSNFKTVLGLSIKILIRFLLISPAPFQHLGSCAHINCVHFIFLELKSFVNKTTFYFHSLNKVNDFVTTQYVNHEKNSQVSRQIYLFLASFRKVLPSWSRLKW